MILLIPSVVFTQDNGMIKGINARHFQLNNKIDTIDFIVLNGNIDTIKPVIIFCQGSKPMPLITKLPSGQMFFTNLTNFDYRNISNDYHLVLISMPQTPLIAAEEMLNRQYCYITDTSNQESYSTLYLNGNYLDNYIRRTKEVISFLYEQNWVYKGKIYLVGHSQGSKVAIGAGLLNNKIAKIGYLSGNPLGRIDQIIREQRKLAKEGKLTLEESQQKIEDIYTMWGNINKNPEAITTEYGDPNKTWTTFSKPMIDDILTITQPLYVAYGTEDITSTFCDLLPIYFINAHKNNLTLKPYIGLEHNYFEIGKDGNPIYERGHWQEVIDNFIKWINE